MCYTVFTMMQYNTFWRNDTMNKNEALAIIEKSIRYILDLNSFFEEHGSREEDSFSENDVEEIVWAYISSGCSNFYVSVNGKMYYIQPFMSEEDAKFLLDRFPDFQYIYNSSRNYDSYSDTDGMIRDRLGMTNYEFYEVISNFEGDVTFDSVKRAIGIDG